MPPANIPRVDSYVDEDLSKYQFGKYAATFFQAQATATHVKKPLKTALLTHTEPSAQLAALTAWTTILRFMGDLADVKPGSTNGSEVYVRFLAVKEVFSSSCL